MKITKCDIEGLLIIEPDIFPDKRGYFCETYSQKKYRDLGVVEKFVQDNVSQSEKNVLRGLHYQTRPRAQAKLVSVIEGEIFDVAVDIRRDSPSFGKWFGINLEGPFRRQLLIPAGFAHGFCVLSEKALVSYKCDAPYSPKHERGLAWNDPEINIGWPIVNPIISERDRQHPSLKEQKVLF